MAWGEGGSGWEQGVEGIETSSLHSKRSCANEVLCVTRVKILVARK